MTEDKCQIPLSDDLVDTKFVITRKQIFDLFEEWRNSLVSGKGIAIEESIAPKIYLETIRIVLQSERITDEMRTELLERGYTPIDVTKGEWIKIHY